MELDIKRVSKSPVQAVLNSAAPTAGLTDFGKQFADWLATITE